VFVTMVALGMLAPPAVAGSASVTYQVVPR
jgi:hypothetical protein